MSSKAKVIDSLLFSGLSAEPELFELRCHELVDVVDVHVVVECQQTFQGAPHEPTFPAVLARLPQFAHKIQYHAVDLPQTNAYPRSPNGREGHARNLLGTLIADGGPDDIVMISDADEIPRAAVLARLVRSGWRTPVQLGMTPYYLWMDLQIASPISEAPGQQSLWNGTLLVRRPTLEVARAFALRDVPGRKLVDGAGWHFSSLGGPEEMQRKLAAWGHPEKNQPPYNDLEHLRRCYAEGRDWDVDRMPPMDLQWVAVDDSYPAYMRDHLKQFEPYIGMPAALTA